jgi:hypothetical protein
VVANKIEPHSSSFVFRDPTGPVKAESRASWEKFGRIAAAEVAEEVGFDCRAGEKRGIQPRIIKPGQRPAI